MSDETPMVAVCRNREGAVLAVWGPYTGDHAKATAEMVAREKGGERQLITAEPLTDQREQERAHYASPKAPVPLITCPRCGALFMAAEGGGSDD